MPFLKKDTAGSDSFGNTWTEDGSVVEVTDEQAAVLLSIPDAGFSEVAEEAAISEAPKPEPEPETAPALGRIPEASPKAAPRGRRPVKE